MHPYLTTVHCACCAVVHNSDAARVLPYLLFPLLSKSPMLPNLFLTVRFHVSRVCRSSPTPAPTTKYCTVPIIEHPLVLTFNLNFQLLLLTNPHVLRALRSGRL